MRDRRRRVTRVLFVNHVAGLSGAQLSLLGLLAKIDRRRVQPFVACPEGELARRVRELGVRHIPVALQRIERRAAVDTALHVLLNVASCVPSFVRAIGRFHIDIVHANSTTAHLYAAVPAKLTGTAIVWHVRDLVELGRAGKLLFRLADAVVCVSEAVERYTARYAGDLDKLWTVTNGIDLSAFRAAARPGTVRSELNIPHDAPVVSQVSQITPWKGHEFLLDAVVRLKSEFPRLRVVMVGEAMTARDARYAERLRRRVRELDLAETVSFTGWREDVASVIADSDVVAMPSRAEPFGRAALEALALARPVVGTNAGGLPELVHHRQTGLLVPYGDVAALADALAKLLRSREIRQHMGKAASADAERYDISRTVGQIQNLYDDLLERG